jgi:hypothetical protein
MYRLHWEVEFASTRDLEPSGEPSSFKTINQWTDQKRLLEMEACGTGLKSRKPSGGHSLIPDCQL